MELKSKFEYIYNYIGKSKKPQQAKKNVRKNQKVNQKENNGRKRNQKKPEEETKLTLLVAKLKTFSGPLLFVVILIIVLAGTIDLSKCGKGYRIVH